jgi:plasmid stability protein
MADVLVRNLGEKTHRELKRRAKQNGHSVNAEILTVLDKAAEPEKQVGLGTQLQEWKKKIFGDDVDFTFEIVQDKTPARFVDFSGPEYDVPESE